MFQSTGFCSDVSVPFFSLQLVRRVSECGIFSGLLNLKQSMRFRQVCEAHLLADRFNASHPNHKFKKAKKNCISKTFASLNGFDYFFHCEYCFQHLCLHAAETPLRALSCLLLCIVSIFMLHNKNKKWKMYRILESVEAMDWVSAHQGPAADCGGGGLLPTLPPVHCTCALMSGGSTVDSGVSHPIIFHPFYPLLLLIILITQSEAQQSMGPSTIE